MRINGTWFTQFLRLKRQKRINNNNKAKARVCFCQTKLSMHYLIALYIGPPIPMLPCHTISSFLHTDQYQPECNAFNCQQEKVAFLSARFFVEGENVCRESLSTILSINDVNWQVQFQFQLALNEWCQS